MSEVRSSFPATAYVMTENVQDLPIATMNILIMGKMLVLAFIVAFGDLSAV